MPLVLIVFCGLILFPTNAFAADASYWSELVFYIRTQQQAFHKELAAAIRAIQEGGVQAIWAMVTISFLYGIFHAAGPGHGKAVISTYLISQESQLKRGIFLSFASAFVQGISAIVLVEGMVGLIGWSRGEAKDAVPVLEQVSFALIALIGIVLMKRVASALWKRHSTHKQHHHHEHSHNHDHNHDDHHCATCGHSHAPSPAQLENSSNLRDTLAIVFSVGIRPCSGSVLVLIFAEIVGLRMAGILSIFAISLGTAITVSALATLAVYFRKGALHLAQKQDSQLVINLSLGAAFIGGFLISAMGISLLIEASQTSHPLF